MKYLSHLEVTHRLPQVNFPVSELEAVDLKHQILSLFPNHRSEDVDFFIHAYQTPNLKVFMDWIEADKTMRECLFQGSISTTWKDVNHVSKHKLFDEFRQFVNQFLYPILQQEVKQLNDKHSEAVMSFTQLLNQENKERLQDVLSDWYIKQVDEIIEKCKKTSKDQQIYQHLIELFTDAFVHGLNYMDERHYGVKMQVLERLTSLMYHRKSSVRLVIYIVNQLCRLDLKQEHLIQLKETETKVRKGEIVVEKNRMPWMRLTLTVLLILIAIGGAIGVFFIEAKTETIADQEETSFMEFSKEERQRLDSLIGKAQRTQRMVQAQDQLDKLLPYTGQALIQKREWTNEKVKSLYHQWSHNDSTIVTNFFSKSSPHSKPYVSTSAFGSTNGTHNGEFHNNSLKSVLILVFTDQKKAPLYTKYVHAKSTASWKFTEGDYILVLPGCVVPGMQQFGDIPFREINQEFYDNLNVAYQLKYNSSKKVKIIWETLGSNNYLVDLNNALERL